MIQKRDTLKGIITPIVTPLIDNYTIDKQGTINLIEHLINGGVHGIFILGTTGESQSLSYRLRYEFTEFVCMHTAGRVPVLVGISDTSLEESIKLAQKAKECGAVAVVSAPPYYYTPSQIELIEYYTKLADAIELSLYLYNMPSCVKVVFEPKTVRAIAEHPNVIGIKDSSANMVYFQNLLYIMADKPDFEIFVGPEELTAECVMMGANGGVNGGANMFPELYVALYNAASANDLEQVKELQKRVMDISSSIYSVGNYSSSYIKGVKCALSLLGICSDYLCHPYQKFHQAERNKIRAILNNLGYQC